jgi:hypothetical protein
MKYTTADFQAAIQLMNGKPSSSVGSSRKFIFDLGDGLSAIVSVRALSGAYYANCGQPDTHIIFNAESSEFHFYGKGARGPLAFQFMNSFSEILTGRKMY